MLALYATAVMSMSVAGSKSTGVAVVKLRNGVEMPVALLGTGSQTWLNDTSTAQAVSDAVVAGFPGIDAANHYGNQAGIREGLADAQARGANVTGVWIQTKVEGCGNSVRQPMREGHCYNDTLAAVRENLQLLGVDRVDLTLLHAPPCVPGRPWVEKCVGNPRSDLVYPLHCDCSAKEPCDMMREQWSALEEAYAANLTRAIGVSNYCAACLECIAQGATITPMVNQFRFHPGMPGADPAGLVSYNRDRGIIPQAYSPLGGGKSELLDNPTMQSIADKYNKSTAQVALRWVLDAGVPLTTAATRVDYMKEDLVGTDSSWKLAKQDFDAIAELNVVPETPTDFCKL